MKSVIFRLLKSENSRTKYFKGERFKSAENLQNYKSVKVMIAIRTAFVDQDSSHNRDRICFFDDRMNNSSILP